MNQIMVLCLNITAKFLLHNRTLQSILFASVYEIIFGSILVKPHTFAEPELYHEMYRPPAAVLFHWCQQKITGYLQTALLVVLEVHLSCRLTFVVSWQAHHQPSTKIKFSLVNNNMTHISCLKKKYFAFSCF
jgi:hypothetical protein